MDYVDDYEWGVVFLPPHVNAYEYAWFDTIQNAWYVRNLGACVLARRPVGEPEILV